jgi:hypothetical protein
MLYDDEITDIYIYTNHYSVFELQPPRPHLCLVRIPFLLVSILSLTLRRIVIRQDISFQQLQRDGDGRPGSEFLPVSDEEPGDDGECEGDEADQG